MAKETNFFLEKRHRQIMLSRSCLAVAFVLCNTQVTRQR